MNKVSNDLSPTPWQQLSPPPGRSQPESASLAARLSPLGFALVPRFRVNGYLPGLMHCDRWKRQKLTMPGFAGDLEPSGWYFVGVRAFVLTRVHVSLRSLLRWVQSGRVQMGNKTAAVIFENSRRRILPPRNACRWNDNAPVRYASGFVAASPAPKTERPTVFPSLGGVTTENILYRGHRPRNLICQISL